MVQSTPEAGLELLGLRAGLAPGDAEDCVAVLFQDALASLVVGAGEQLVVSVAAVGFEDYVVVGPEEVWDVAEQRLVT